MELKWKAALVLALAAGMGLAVWEHPPSKAKLLDTLNRTRFFLNHLAKPYEAWQIIFFCIGLTLLLTRLYFFLNHEEMSLWQRAKMTGFRILRSLPFIRSKIKSELDKALLMMEKEFLTPKPGESYRPRLPEKSMTDSEILGELDNMDQMAEINWREGRVSGCSYNCNPALTDLTTKVYGRYSWTNPLHPDVFPEVRKMEAEVIQWGVNLFHGGPDACGAMTSGGTESILLAMKAYREVGYERGIRFPEIVCPLSAHCAFEKAANYFRMKIVVVPIDPTTCKVNMSAMARAITKNTVVLVGSAPQYPHGIIDPIQEIAQLGRKHKIGVHVDCCLGGFLLPFMDKAGFKLRPFDFRVKGVTSISADTHKFGFSPKGSSIIMYSSKELRKKQFFISTDWPGGIYATPNLGGSRPGGIIAATWATMLSFGMEGYTNATRRIVRTTQIIIQELRKLHGIYILGDPQVCIIAIASKEFDIYRLFEYMTKKKWSLNALQFPPSLHFCVTHVHTQAGKAEEFINDIKAGVVEILRHPDLELTGKAAIYGTTQAVADRSIIADVAGGFLDTLYKATPPSNHTVPNGEL